MLHIATSLPFELNSTALSYANFEIPTFSVDLLRNFTNLEHLSATNCQIHNISSDVFGVGNAKLVEKLKSLNFSSNKLENLAAAMFSGAAGLEVLNLSNNLISGISLTAFQGLNNLKELYLDRNKITKLDGQVFDPIATSVQILRLDVSIFYDCETVPGMPGLHDTDDVTKCDRKKFEDLVLFENIPILDV
jgi:Leucine-rich repeat (LRR) protein